MTRLARGRDTHLLPEEIAVEALRQFDAGTADPSIRQLAAALGVTPSAIYHHFPSRAAIIEAAVELVWGEVVIAMLELEPNPLEADPVDVLIASGLATRRAFGRHHRIAPYMAATPRSNQLRANTLALLANAFERMGLTPERAAEAFHAYAAFTVGTTLFAATRRVANERLDATAAVDPAGAGPFRSTPSEGLARLSRPETRAALDDVVEVSALDPARDERLFEDSLRHLVESFAE
jgi:TetR/AcrR family tetracycline transcriptional repressor